MSTVEELLKQGLQQNPEDWSVRLELASKLASNQDLAGAESVLSSSPVPPPGRGRPG